MPANLSNSAVAIGLEKVSFHSNPKEGQCQWTLKFSSVQSLSRVQLFATPWIKAHQASLSITNSRVHSDSRPWMLKLPYTVHISHASKVMLKILQARLQQYTNHKFQMFKLDLDKAEKPKIKLWTSVGS